MKRLVRLAAAVTIAGMLAIPAAAQVIIQPEIGVNFANLTNADAGLADLGADAKMRTAFVAGVGILFPLSPRFGIGAGGYYSQQGVKASASGQSDVTFELDYIQVPVTAGLSFPSGGAVTPHLFAGPMIGFNTTCKLSGGGASIDCDADAVKGTDFGLLFGGGLGFKVGTGSFVLNAYYDLGLTNVVKDPVSGDPSLKHRVFGFSLGYAFPLGGSGM